MGKIDVIIGEVKTGDSRPNSVWGANGNLGAIEYLVRFIGLCSTDDEVRKVALELTEFCQPHGVSIQSDGLLHLKSSRLVLLRPKPAMINGRS